MVEADIPAQRNQPVFLSNLSRIRGFDGGGNLPGEGAGVIGSLFQFTVLFFGVAKGDLAFINLRFLIHHLKDPLRAGEGGQEEVDLLGKLVDGHGALAHVHQIGSHRSQIRQPGKGEEPSHAGGDGVVYIA